MLALCSLAQARLKVLSPDSLADSFESKKITYVTAHFGNVPYGSEIVGFVHRPTSLKGCSEIEQLDPFDEDDDQPILLIERGDCQFFTKALNAQHAGAKMLIIYDHKSDYLNYYPVSYDKRAQEITIPTIVVGNSDGKKLMEVLNGVDETAKSLILEFELPLPEKDEVTMNIVMSAADLNAYEFMTHFADLMNSLGEKFKLKPLFFTNRLWEAEGGDIDQNCLGGKNDVCLSTVDNPQLYLGLQVYQACLLSIADPGQFMKWNRLSGQNASKMAKANPMTIPWANASTFRHSVLSATASAGKSSTVPRLRRKTATKCSRKWATTSAKAAFTRIPF